MLKLIAFVTAAIPVVLFLKAMFFGKSKTFFAKSKVVQEASSTFRRQVGYLAWGIVVLVGCALAYSVAVLAYSFWK